MSLKLRELAKPGDIIFYCARLQSPMKDKIFAYLIRGSKFERDPYDCVRATVVSEDIDYEFDIAPPRLRLKRINWDTGSMLWEMRLFRANKLGFNQVSDLLRKCYCPVGEERSWLQYWFGAIAGQGDYINVEFIMRSFNRVGTPLDEYMKLAPSLGDLQTSLALTKVGEEYVDLRG